MSVGIELYKKEKLLISEPKMFNIVFHDDDITPQDYVVDLLVDVFQKDYFLAKKIMLAVHNNGEEVVGTYSYDIAHSKKLKADQRSIQFCYPLKITVDEAMN